MLANQGRSLGNVPSGTFPWTEMIKFQRAFQIAGPASGNVPSSRYVSLDGNDKVPEGVPPSRQ